MERTHHLAELSSLVAAIRAQGRTARLVVRNVDRLGLIHLYFGEGHLLHVEGHVGNPDAALRDLASWYHGAVRVDAVAAPPASGAGGAEALDAALTRTLGELEARGVVRPAPPSVAPSAASAFQFSTSAPSAPSAPTGPRMASMPQTPHTPQTPANGQLNIPPLPGPLDGASGLPPLRDPTPIPARGGPTGTLDMAPDVSQSSLSDPQWHLLALAVRQIVEHMGRLLGVQMADGLIRGALAGGARRDLFLSSLEIDTTGWLRAREEGAVARFDRDTVVEAIADLITRFETQCAELLGEQRAHELIASAAMPMRASLEQIGLTIKTS